MKVLRIIFIVIVVALLLALIGGFIFLKTLDVNKFKPQIISQASAALGRPFDFKDIQLQVSLKDGIRLNLKELTIGDDPRFQAADFLKVDNVFLGVDLLSFLTKGGKITVSTVQVQSPRIALIKNEAGELNVQTMGAKPSSPAASSGQATNTNLDQSLTPSTAPAAPAAEPKRVPTGVPILPPLLVDSININNATVTYIDRSFQPALSVEADQLNTQVFNFTLNRFFTFLVSGRIFGSEKNFKVNGKAKVNVASGEIVGSVNLAADLQKFSLEQIKALPVLKGVPFPEALQGQIQVNVKDLSAGPQGVGKFTADVDFSQGAIAMKEIVPGIALSASQIDFKLRDLSLNSPFNFNI